MTCTFLLCLNTVIAYCNVIHLFISDHTHTYALTPSKKKILNPVIMCFD